MTMPHLMNCPHSGEGWCLDCVASSRAERDAAVKRFEDKRLEVHNVCKDRAAAEKKLAELQAEINRVIEVSDKRLIALDQARNETEAWIAKWKVQEDYRIRCATQADQIARLRESLESCVERIVSDIGPSAGEAAAALIVLKETAP